MVRKQRSIREFLRKRDIKKKRLSYDKDSATRFKNVCSIVYKRMKKIWDAEYEKGEKAKEVLERIAGAIIGEEKALKFFKDQIFEILKEENLDTESHPPYYTDLVDAVFHTNWGLDVISEWFHPKYHDLSESCRIVGDRVFFLIQGKLELMPQRLPLERFHQLKEALLLNAPKQRLDNHEAEVYMVDHTRVKIYDEGLAKEGKPAILFRRDTVKNPTLEDHKDRRTFPYGMVLILEAIMEMRANLAITGPMRSAKTAVLKALVKLLPQNAEMFQIETDPEVNFDKILENNAVIELVTDDPEAIARLRKDVVRGDCIDGLIMAEVRDGRSLRLLSKMGNIGVDGVLVCYHNKAGNNNLYGMAQEVKEIYGGNVEDYMYNLAETLDFNLSMTSRAENKSQKRMAMFEEYSIDPCTNELEVRRLVEYDYLTDSWYADYVVSDRVKALCAQYAPHALEKYERGLRMLYEANPMETSHVYSPIRDKEVDHDQQRAG